MNISDVNNDGIAMDGFDPVAHFEGEPLRGSDEFRFVIGDLTYHFSSQENMEKFEKTPAKFLPIAGGYPTGSNVAPPEITSVDGKVVGNKTFANRRSLEDTPVSMENNVPIDMKEDGDLEMQNLSDSEK